MHVTLLRSNSLQINFLTVNNVAYNHAIFYIGFRFVLTIIQIIRLLRTKFYSVSCIEAFIFLRKVSSMRHAVST
jgi:hypothetical protein